MTTRLVKILAHACIVLVLVLLTLLVFDHLNPSMDFINNPYAKVLIALFCLLSFTLAVLFLAACRARRR